MKSFHAQSQKLCHSRDCLYYPLFVSHTSPANHRRRRSPSRLYQPSPASPLHPYYPSTLRKPEDSRRVPIGTVSLHATSDQEPRRGTVGRRDHSGKWGTSCRPRFEAPRATTTSQLLPPRPRTLLKHAYNPIKTLCDTLFTFSSLRFRTPYSRHATSRFRTAGKAGQHPPHGRS
jgi:hypothetical protein